jgi:hypothetical protein
LARSKDIARGVDLARVDEFNQAWASCNTDDGSIASLGLVAAQGDALEAFPHTIPMPKSTRQSLPPDVLDRKEVQRRDHQPHFVRALANTRGKT